MTPRWRRDRRGGRLESLLFAVMGPPQLGEQREREGFVPDPQADLCRTCDRPWAEHERVATGSMTYLRCPA